MDLKEVQGWIKQTWVQNTISGISIAFRYISKQSDDLYLKKQVDEYWNVFGNTLGNYVKTLKYTPMHLTQVFENSIWKHFQIQFGRLFGLYK